jgi:hypothetical protein
MMDGQGGEALAGITTPSRFSGHPALERRPRRVRTLVPFVFDAPSVWQHPRPLLDVLATDHGHLDLEAMDGSYGWVIKYSQQAKFRALGIRTLGEYLRLFTGGVRDRPLPYVMHVSIRRNLPELLPHFVPCREFRPNWATAAWLDRLAGPELFIGPAGSGFGPIHIDHASVHVGFYQFQGEKKFILFPPGDGRYLYRYRGAQFPWQLRNARPTGWNYTDLARFPLVSRTNPVTLTLRAGQALFMPADWWHTTINLTDSVSYSIRIVNHTNVLKTLGHYLAGPGRAVLKAFGR